MQSELDEFVLRRRRGRQGSEAGFGCFARGVELEKDVQARESGAGREGGEGFRDEGGGFGRGEGFDGEEVWDR